MGVRLAGDTTTSRLRSQLVAALVFVAAAGTLVLPSAPLPRLAIIAPITYFVVCLADAATALILFGTLGSARSGRSTVALALSFSVSAIVIVAALLVLPLLPGEPPVLSAPSQSGIWLFVFWHVDCAAGALIYLAIRRRDDGRRASRRFIRLGAAVAAIGTAITITVPFTAGAWLPVLAQGSSVAALRSTGAGPCTAALLALAAVLVFRLRDPLPIERALAFSLLSLAAGMTLFFVNANRYSPAFYAGRGLLLIGSLLVLIAAVRGLVTARERLATIEGALSRAVGESAQQAGRIRAVWEIASQPEQSDDDRYNAILQIATAALRPGTPMFGTLSHVDGEQLVFDATSWSGAAGRAFTDRRRHLSGCSHPVRYDDAEPVGR